jgi:hypothetical protein
MSNELKERNISKLIFIVRFACATLDVEHSIRAESEFFEQYLKMYAMHC